MKFTRQVCSQHKLSWLLVPWLILMLQDQQNKDLVFWFGGFFGCPLPVLTKKPRSLSEEAIASLYICVQLR